MPHLEEGRPQRPPPPTQPKPDHPEKEQEKARSKGYRIGGRYSIATWQPSADLNRLMDDMMPNV